MATEQYCVILSLIGHIISTTQTQLYVRSQMEWIVQYSIIFIYISYWYYKKNSILKRARKEIFQDFISDAKIQIFDRQLKEIYHSKERHVSDYTLLMTPKNTDQELQFPIQNLYKIYTLDHISLDYVSTPRVECKTLEELINLCRQDTSPKIIQTASYDSYLHKKVKYQVILNQKLTGYFIICYIQLNNQNHIQNTKIQKFKANLSAAFSHKLKTPLNSAIGHLISASHDQSVSTLIHEKYLKPTLLNCKLQLYQFQDALALINCDSEQFTTQINKVNILDILQDVYDLIIEQCTLKHIKLDFYVNNIDWRECGRRGLKIFTDENKITRILYNLLNNSYRNTHEGGQISLHVKYDQNSIISFKLQDTSVGMTYEKVEQLNSQLRSEHSNKYIYMNSSTKKNTDKTAVGSQLIITNKLIKILNNENVGLSIQQPVDGGAVFTFQICSTNEVQSDASLKESRLQSIKNQRSLRILANQTNSPSISKFGNDKRRKPSQREALIKQLHQFVNVPEPPLQETEIQEPKAQNPIKFNNTSNVKLHIRLNKQSRLNSIKLPLGRDKSMTIMNEQRQRQISSNRLAFPRFDLQYDFADCSPKAHKTSDYFIQIVDDEPFNHQTLRMMLQNLGYKKFLEAYHGQQCVEQVLKHHSNIKLIIMDIDMPVMDGLQATKVLVDLMNKQQIAAIPIVGCTAHEDIDTHQSCYDAGMVNVVTKPVLPRNLQNAINLVNELLNENKPKSISLSMTEKDKDFKDRVIGFY
ncbi:hypothetical protein pb186bvf_010600 [Paramecium bursaria]